MLPQRLLLCARGLQPLRLPAPPLPAAAAAASGRCSSAAAAAPLQRMQQQQLWGCMRPSSPKLAGLEDYYVSAQVATCIQAPMAYYVWFGWGFLMAFVTFGSLLHSNYYFSGRAIPKPSSNTQLLDD